MSDKKFVKNYFITLSIMLFIVIGYMVICDPYFHYHKPMFGLSYDFNDERYQNNGLTRHYEYDALITGTSMTENFKTTETDELFNVNSIKTSFAGGTFKEINDHVERAIKYNPDLKMVIRCLDTLMIEKGKDEMAYESYPDYLYDDNLFNDVYYVFNKSIMLSVNYKTCLTPTLANIPTTTFDDYSSWYHPEFQGKQNMFSHYLQSVETKGVPTPLTEEQKITIIENVTQNALNIAIENPDIDFYYFYPPYSMGWFDLQRENSEIQAYVERLTLATEVLINQENIHLFSFYDDHEMILDFSHYQDVKHYDKFINSEMLERMSKDEGLLTKDNYIKHFEEMEDYYVNYDYLSMFAGMTRS